jgi:hypothetical protein
VLGFAQWMAFVLAFVGVALLVRRGAVSGAQRAPAAGR